MSKQRLGPEADIHTQHVLALSLVENVRWPLSIWQPGSVEESFRLRYFAADLNRAQEAVSVPPAAEGAMFQDHKVGTRPLITLVEKTVVVSERYLNEHLHGPNLISKRRQSMSQI